MELDRNEIIKFINQSPQRSIFCFPWWLDIVAEDRYSYIALHNNGQIEAMMPVVTEKKYGLAVCTMPPFTQSLGVLLPPMQGKYVTQLSNEHKLVDGLIDKLPDCHYYNFRMSPYFENWLPFYWNNFEQTTWYTYVITDLSNLDSIWEGMRSNIRREIRKAKKQVTVEQKNDPELLQSMVEMTYDRQDKEPSFNYEKLKRICNTSIERDQGTIFFARDEQDRVHSGLFLVWDDRTAYYLVGGSDPELRTSGAASLLMWEAIQFAQDKVKEFNFEGSMIQSIERFFRAFGGQQQQYFKIKKFRSKLLSAAGRFLLKD